MSAADRIRRDYTVLAVLEIVRSEADDQRLGKRLEMAILEAQLRDIELSTELDSVDREIRVRCN